MIEPDTIMLSISVRKKEKIMSLIQLIIILVVIGVVMWLINTYVPMSHGIKTVLNVVVVLFVILYVLSLFGILGPIHNVRIGRL